MSKHIKQLKSHFPSLFTSLILAACFLAITPFTAKSQSFNLNAETYTSSNEPLPLNEAFAFDYRQEEDKVILDFSIADKHYLYADKFLYDSKDVNIVEVQKGKPKKIDDEIFGITDAYFSNTQIILTVKRSDTSKQGDSTRTGQINITYQGCFDKVFCYNPVNRSISIDLDSITSEAAQYSQPINTSDEIETQKIVTQSNPLVSELDSTNIAWTLLIFLGLGVALSLTPCVFPMLPILSSIIVKQPNISPRRGLSLSFIYVQGMAITYSLMGVAVAYMGAEFQAATQHPVVLIFTALIFVLLAGSMFGWYNIGLPNKLSNKLSNISQNQSPSKSSNVFIMGALSGLIASPCTTAPLTGALLYIAQTGDLMIGFLALYALSLGMGAPLLAIGISGGNLLPKAGQWMNFVKNTFGFLLLLVPLILLERVIDIEIIILLFSVLVLAYSAYLHYNYLSTTKASVRSGFWVASFICLAAGIAMTVSLIYSHKDISDIIKEETTHIEFKQVGSYSEMMKEVDIASNQGKPVMFDLYADWCIACKEFEVRVFSDEKVVNKLDSFTLIQMDMTSNSPEAKEIYEQFGIMGLPTILFFDAEGTELTNHRISGFMNSEAFIQHLDALPTPPQGLTN